MSRERSCQTAYRTGSAARSYPGRYPPTVFARLIFAVVLACAPCGASAIDAGEAARRIIEGTNVFREAQELEPVKPHPELHAAAAEFARYMAKTGKYGHGADGRRPDQRAAAQGYEYCIVSENIAYQYRSGGYGSVAVLAGQFVEGWKNSPEHRKNMVDPAVMQTGVGVAQDEKGRYFAVQMFGRPKSASIRFSVRNESGGEISYRAGGREYSLEPRAVRTHSICRPVEVSIRRSGEAAPFRAQAVDGARFNITAKGVARLR